MCCYCFLLLFSNLLWPSDAICWHGSGQHWLKWWLVPSLPLPEPMLTVQWCHNERDSIIMSTIASQITSLTIVYSVVYSGVDQRKHQISASLAFVRGIHRWPVNSPHKWPVTRKMFPFDDVIMTCHQWGSVACKWGKFYSKFSRIHELENYTVKIIVTSPRGQCFLYILSGWGWINKAMKATYSLW